MEGACWGGTGLGAGGTRGTSGASWAGRASGASHKRCQWHETGKRGICTAFKSQMLTFSTCLCMHCSGCCSRGSSWLSRRLRGKFLDTLLSTFVFVIMHDYAESWPRLFFQSPSSSTLALNVLEGSVCCTNHVPVFSGQALHHSRIEGTLRHRTGPKPSDAESSGFHVLKASLEASEDVDSM